ncbi:threonine aldolase family protein [Nocardia terpenica]|uniref:Threonine aldolase n=1 Tax=Nocardia terpenica TaxID=455432 RepID=A0A164KUX6_9NOCA|nr:low specificity L-threonine aldolase [Nocardia terpenica]KZM71733.1 threonine aldolase [Nocardia terpenica]NQE90982.1 low specificity L-threonine aldolase [Nocardia terpenica]
MTEVVRRHDPAARSFASDNWAGIHPEVLAALAVANGGHQSAYGADDYTVALGQTFARHFGEGARVYPVCTGTGANVVALQALLPRWGAVISAETAHVNSDECGAAEKVGGIKIYPVPTPDGKLTPELIDRQAWGRGDAHRAQPLAVSITQSTELGTCYTVEEIRALCRHAHDLGMLVHLDGARIANAAAHLGVSLRACTTDAGVDIVSFGGTKNGLMLGEAVVALTDRIHDIEYLRMSSTQLASKMRFVSVQLEALLGGDLWLRNATRANAMATRLAVAAGRVDGVRIAYPVQANEVFAALPPEVTDRLRKRYFFHVWDEDTGVVRWVCSFDTTPDDVDAFVAALAEEASAARPLTQ